MAAELDDVELAVGKVEEESGGSDKLKDLSVLVCSWNVGNEKPKSDFDPWIPRGGGGYDVIAVGTQECKYSVKGAGDSTPAAEDESKEIVKDGTGPRSGNTDAQKSKSAAHFFSVVQDFVGDGYAPVQHVVLWEMRLIIFVRKALLPKVKNVEKAWEATGILHVCGNKGGLVVKLEIFDTTLCFVSCHLAAHAKHLSVRNKNVEEVLNEVRLDDAQIDVDCQYNHVFWLGDLNYRVQLDLNSGSKMEHGAHVAKVQKLINAKNWKALYASDQLVKEMKNGRVFVGFTDCKPQFNPTFKVERAPGFTYKTKRVPSYCDRVLWKSTPGRAADVALRKFATFDNIDTSDHKPVAASFTITCRRKVKVGHGSPSQYPRIVFTDLAGDNMWAADPSGLSDPYVRFLSSPPGLFTDKPKAPQTYVVKNTLSPRFKNAAIPNLKARVTSGRQLAKCSVILSVWDFDHVSADDRMGQAVLGLADAVKASGPVAFSLPVSRCGVQRGTISGKVEVVWPGDPNYESGGSTADAGHGCCVIS